MRTPVRVAVLDALFCMNVGCQDCHRSQIGGASDYVDCSRADCDNHKRGNAVLPASPEPPFDLPDGSNPPE